MEGLSDKKETNRLHSILESFLDGTSQHRKLFKYYGTTRKTV